MSKPLKKHDSYLGSQSMRATSSSMALAAMILGFDIVELWSEVHSESDHGKTTLHCTYVHASDNMIKQYPGIIVGHYPNHKNQHKVSPKLCQLAKESPTRHYWRNIEDAEGNFHPNFLATTRTEVAYWLEGDFNELNVFIVGFALKSVPFKQSKLKFLNGIGYAIYVAAFDLDEDDFSAETVTDLDNKEFIPRVMSSTFSISTNYSTTNLQPMSSANSKTGSVSNNGLSEFSLAIESPSQFTRKPIGSPISPTKRSSSLVLPTTSSMDGIDMVINNENHQTQISISNISLSSDNLHKQTIDGTNLHQQPPYLLHQDSFSYSILDLPVVSPVPNNLSMNNFDDVKHIADGSNSNIYLAKLENTKCILKLIKESCHQDMVALHEFEMEYSILIRLNHPNIIKLLGAGNTPRKFIVLEYLGGGTLNTILSQNQSKPGLASKLFRKPSFTYVNLLLKLKEISEAFNYLHHDCHKIATIIHRDLKPDNVGFTADGVLKLFDFGLCTCVKRRHYESEVYELTGNTGSLRYMAPEVALKKPYNEKVDVYSFGIMAWQMARDRTPFKGMSRDDFMKIVALNHERPPLDSGWPSGFSDLLTSCWDHEPVNRPSFNLIISELIKLIDDCGGKEKPKSRNVFSFTAKKSSPQSTWF